LRSTLKWQHFYLYVLLDIFSRYVVGRLVASAENAALAKALIEETCAKHDDRALRPLIGHRRPTLSRAGGGLRRASRALQGPTADTARVTRRGRHQLAATSTRGDSHDLTTSPALHISQSWCLKVIDTFRDREARTEPGRRMHCSNRSFGMVFVPVRYSAH
jgi:hypothetical protein